MTDATRRSSSHRRGRTLIGRVLFLLAFTAGVFVADGPAQAQMTKPAEARFPAAMPAQALPGYRLPAGYTYSTLEPLSADELDAAQAMRQDMQDWLEGMLTVYPHLAAYGETSMQATMQDALGDLGELTPEQLLELRSRFGAHPGFWEYPEYLRSIFEPGVSPPPFYAQSSERIQRSLREGLFRGGPRFAPGSPVGMHVVLPPDPTPTAPFPELTPFPTRSSLPELPESRGGCPGWVGDEQSCGECPDGAGTEAEFAANVILTTAENVDDATISSDELCLFPGVGVTVPDIFSYIVTGIRMAAAAAALAIEFSNELEEVCLEGYHNAITDLFLDETISSRLAQSSLDRAAEERLRVVIENNLLEDSDRRIGMLQWPQHICGDPLPAATAAAGPDPTPTPTGLEGYRNCGKLELVRDIVEDTILDNSAAGMTIDLNGAQEHLVAGDMHYMNSQWKSAFERYSNAYRLAVRPASTR